MHVAHVDIDASLSLQGCEPLDHDIVEQRIRLGGVQEEDAVQGDSGQSVPHQRHKCLDDLILDEIPLAKDRQDVLDPGPGRLAEDVFIRVQSVSLQRGDLPNSRPA